MNPETTTGGVALKFYSSLRLEVRKSGSIKKVGAEAEIVGNRVKVKIVKNKFAPPFKTVEFPIIYGLGISYLDIMMDIAVKHDIIKKSGSWFSYGEIKIGQGSDKVKDFLKSNADINDEIELKVKKILGMIPEEDEVKTKTKK